MYFSPQKPFRPLTAEKYTIASHAGIQIWVNAFMESENEDLDRGRADKKPDISEAPKEAGKKYTENERETAIQLFDSWDIRQKTACAYGWRSALCR